MARAWVHDRTKDAAYRDQVAKAKAAKRKPPWRWQVRWIDPDGKRCTELREKKVDADDYADEIASQLVRGIYRDPKAGRAKLKAVAEEWYAAKAPRWAPKTKRHVRSILDGYVLPEWKAVPVGAVEYGSYASWLASLYQRPGLQGSKKRTVGASRVQGIHHVMLSVMAWGVRSRRIFENPLSGLDTLPEVLRGKRLYLDHAQIATLAAEVGAQVTAYGKPRPGREMNELMVETMAYCGLRIGETLALRAGSVDLDALELHVVEAVIEGEDGKPTLGLPKGGRIRVVGLPLFLAVRLKAIMPVDDPEALVFPSPRGTMYSAYNWRERVFRPAVKSAGLPKGVTPHTLRHSFASLAVASGADVKTLQSAMGHATATMTLDTYADLYPPRVAEVALALGAAREVALAA